MSRRREWLLVFLLVAVTVALAVLSAPREGREQDSRPSTLRSAPRGARALYLTLDLLGIPVERRFTPLVGGEPLDGPLALLAPTTGLTPAERDSLLAWIRSGGTLLYVSGRDRSLDAALGLVTAAVSPRGDRKEGSAPAEERAFPVRHRWTAGVRYVPGFQRVFADSSQVIRTGAAITLLRTAAEQPAVVTWRSGSGTVVAWSDSRPLLNQALGSEGAAVLFARAAAEASGGAQPLQFDEFHHGFRGGGTPAGGLARFLLRSPAGHLALQLTAAGLGLLLLLGVRLGPPTPPPPPLRRSPLEHVDALAEVYRQAAARRTARRLLVAQVARRVGRTAPRSAEEERDLLQDLRERASRPEAAEKLLREWELGEQAELVTLARELDRLYDEVTRA